MHMSDALLSPQVGGAMWVAAAGCVAYAVRKSRAEEVLEAGKAPLMGVMGAFVFAAQMINFTIPGTGSSGHISGALLLSAVLGAPAALLTMVVILAIQALFFADGGLLALGANIINMGGFTCLIAYPLLFKPMVRKSAGPGRVMAASLLTAVVGLQMGALAVVLETLLSGKTTLPFGPFALLMQPIHLAIGIGEGLITAAVLAFLLRTAPEAVTDLRAGSSAPLPKRALALLAALALAVGGVLSWFASTRPDGLEWSVQGVSGEEPEALGGVYDALSAVQERTAFLPDYGFRSTEPAQEQAPAESIASSESSEQAAWPAVDAGTSFAGVVGAGITLLLAALAGLAIWLPRRKRRSAQRE